METDLKKYKRAGIYSLDELSFSPSKAAPYIVYYAVSKEVIDSEIYYKSIWNTLSSGGKIYLLVLDIPEIKFPILVESLYQYNKAKENIKKYYNRN